jgi:hypothetical protein
MASESGNGLAHGLLDFFLHFPLVAEAQMFGPGDTDHDPDAGLGGQVEEMARRHVIHADGIDAGPAHEVEVADNGGVLGQGFAPGILRERPVSHALDEELGVAGEEIAALGAYAGEAGQAGKSFFDLEHGIPFSLVWAVGVALVSSAPDRGTGPGIVLFGSGSVFGIRL